MVSGFGWNMHLPEAPEREGTRAGRLAALPLRRRQDRAHHVPPRRAVRLALHAAEARRAPQQLVDVLGHEAAIWCVGNRTFVLLAARAAARGRAAGVVRAGGAAIESVAGRATNRSGDKAMNIRWVVAAVGCAGARAADAERRSRVAVPRRARHSAPGTVLVSRRRQAGEPELHAEGHRQQGREAVRAQGQSDAARLLGDLVRACKVEIPVVHRVPGEVRQARAAGGRRVDRRHGSKAEAVRRADEDELHGAPGSRSATTCRTPTGRSSASRSRC